MFDEYSFLPLAELDGWVYRNGNDLMWASPELETSSWQDLKPTELASEMENEHKMVEGWFRIKIRLDESLADEKFSAL